MKRQIPPEHSFQVCIVLTLTTFLAFHIVSANAQDRSYSYDKAGNLTSIGKIDTGDSDSNNCGSTGNQCDNGAGMCVSGKCVTPPCNDPSCSSSSSIPSPTPVVLYCGDDHCNPPAQPKLVSGGLHGHQVCGTFAGDGASFSFTCDPLPSNVDSGWQLTPAFLKSSDGKCYANLPVVLKVTAQTQTELYIEYENAGGTIPQTQVTRNGGDAEVKEVGPGGQVAEVLSDDGYNRIWTLQFLVNISMDVAKVNIYNVGSIGTANGVKSINPLRVWFLRDPSEVSDGSSCN